MKVLEVNVDDHLYGGVYVLVRDIIKNLPVDISADIAALEPFDNEKHVEELNSYNSTVYYVGSEKNKLLKQIHIYKKVKKLVNENKYDAVHLHSDVAHKILVSALASRKSGKLIFHSHASDAEGSHLEIRRKFHYLCCKLLRKIPAIYIATSREAGEWMFPWVPIDNITILDNGIDYQRYRYNADKRTKIRSELGIKNDFLVGLFGRFVPPKNPFFAIEILQELLEEDERVKLLCIGEGPLKEEFIDIARNKGVSDHIYFVGSTDRIEDYYQAIDALIMPSHFEGFGLVAVESQVSGTPTFVSENVPEMTRISELIRYLPIQEASISLWKEELNKVKQHMKVDVCDELNKRFELNTLVDKIVTIYRGQT